MRGDGCSEALSNVWGILQAMTEGYTNEQLFELTNMDPWFLGQFRELHNTEEWMKTKSLGDFSTEELIQIKKRGFSDPQIAMATGAVLQIAFQRHGFPGVRHACGKL